MTFTKALNIILAELREVSKDSRTNNFDHVMKQLPPEIRRHVKVNMSPVYWEENDYDPEYAAEVARHIV
jgi:hypothetical protein